MRLYRYVYSYDIVTLVQFESSKRKKAEQSESRCKWVA